jgi:serine/threonine-protein kinase
MSQAQTSEKDWLDEQANRFERDWKQGGERPRIEDYLASYGLVDRRVLLVELLRRERELRKTAGEEPHVDEYVERFPDERAAVEAAFGITPPPTSRRQGPPVSAAQSLLFGLLALHNNFIDRDTLLAAFNAWIADKSQSLGQILLDRGALTPARHSVLLTLVHEHLQQHGFDPERSLAVVTVAPSVRDELDELRDFDLQSGLLYLRLAGADADEQTDSEKTTDRDDETAATDTGGRFRIVRFHDRGALGEVYVARDQQLHRIVALKRIKLDHASDKDKRARFVVEAEITGRLEHPGIVPVYGLGTYEDGRPFYAMRFIRGDNLKSAIEQFHQAEDKGRDPGQRNLALLKLLRRFLDVCNAIDYAHSRGVLHRDLKPGNIMLGKFGETLVVDWGLAKSVGRPEPAPASATLDDRTLVPQSGSDLRGTEVGARLGTPAYMSPEQAAGRIDSVGPASDVYSLGATLYCLLTGRAPFNDQEMPELLRNVEHGDFPPPRQLKGWVDPALDAICLKSMATDPAQRYRTPRALADDVEHWLADEPVSAWREPGTRRLIRVLKRNRTAVVGVAAAMMAALVGLAAVSAVQARANGQLKRANQALHTANTQLFAAKEEVTRSNEQVTASRDRERERFSLAMKAIKLFHDEVSQDLLLKEKEFDKLRTKLLRGAAGFYTELEALLKSQSDPASRAALARAYDELGELTEKIGVKTEALAVRRKGIALRRGLAARSEVGGEAGLELARGLIATADLQAQTGDQAGALAALEEVRGLVDRPVVAGPVGDRARAVLGLALRQSGDLLWNQGKRDDARARLERARAIFQSLAEANPAVIRHQIELAVCHSTLGIWLGGNNPDHPAAALAAHERALAIRQKLADAHPDDADLRAGLADGFETTGSALMQLGRRGKALERLKRSRAAWKRLADANPAVTFFQLQEARLLNAIGNALNGSGKDADAVLVYREALSRFQKLTSAHPDEVSLQVRLGYVHNNLGGCLQQLGDLAGAVDEYGQGAAVFRTLADAHPEEPVYRNDQIYRQNWASLVLRKLGRPAEALELDRQSVDLAQRLGQQNPEWFVLTEALCSLALSLSDLGDTAAAVAAVRHAVGISDRQPRDSANNCYMAAKYRAGLWTVSGGVASGVSEVARESVAGTAMALFRQVVEFGDKATFSRVNLLEIPELFRQRADFRLFLMDVQMPDDPFAGS